MLVGMGGGVWGGAALGGEGSAARVGPEQSGEVVEAAQLEDLVRELGSDVPARRVAAADALGRLGPAGIPAIGAMLSAMNQAEAWVVFAMMDGIKAMGPPAQAVLLDTFERGSAEVRVRAGQVLWGLGAEARAGVPRLKKLLEDEDPNVREMAGVVIKRIEEELEAGPGVPGGEGRTQPPQFGLLAPVRPTTGAATADWPGFRGPNRDGLCPETGLLEEWPENGPPLLWRLDGLGRGFSSVSIAGGRLFTMGDRSVEGERAQWVLAFDLASRQELWATRIGPPHTDGPRCTPTVDGAWLYALGTDGDLVCLEAATGALRWQRHLVKDFGGRMMSGWKYCESPLVDGDRLICTPGGEKAALVALDKRTGQVQWQSVVPVLGPRGKDGAAYSSPMVAEIEGVRQYVQVLGRGVVGVAADTGRFLWGYNRIANDTANIANPAIRGQHVFVANSYNAGSALLEIRRTGDQFAAEEAYYLEAKRFDNHHGGLVLVGDHVYGGAGLNKGDPACVDFVTGEILWKTKAPSSGSAAVVYADGHVLFRYDRGVVVRVAADPRSFRPRGQFKSLTADGPAWAHPVIHGRRLYLRHNDLLACYDLSADR